MSVSEEVEVKRIVSHLEAHKKDDSLWKDLFNKIDTEVFFEQKSTTFFKSTIYLSFFMKEEKFKNTDLYKNHQKFQGTSDFAKRAAEIFKKNTVTFKDFSDLMGDGYGTTQLKDMGYAGQLFYNLLTKGNVLLTQLPQSIETARLLWRFYQRNSEYKTVNGVREFYSEQEKLQIFQKVVEVWEVFKTEPRKGTRKAVISKLKELYEDEYEKMIEKKEKTPRVEKVVDKESFGIAAPTVEPVTSRGSDDSGNRTEDDIDLEEPSEEEDDLSEQTIDDLVDVVVEDVDDSMGKDDIIVKYRKLKRKFEEFQEAEKKSDRRRKSPARKIRKFRKMKSDTTGRQKFGCAKQGSGSMIFYNGFQTKDAAIEWFNKHQRVYHLDNKNVMVPLNRDEIESDEFWDMED